MKRNSRPADSPLRLLLLCLVLCLSACGGRSGSKGDIEAEPAEIAEVEAEQTEIEPVEAVVEAEAIEIETPLQGLQSVGVNDSAPDISPNQSALTCPELLADKSSSDYISPLESNSLSGTWLVEVRAEEFETTQVVDSNGNPSSELNLNGGLRASYISHELVTVVDNQDGTGIASFCTKSQDIS